MSAEIIWPDSGELIRRIVIKTWTTTPNIEEGQTDLNETYPTQIIRWAKKDPVRGGLNWDNMQLAETPTHLFYVRFGAASTGEPFGTSPDDLSGQKVIEHDSHRYRILSALDMGNAQRYTQILAKDLGRIS